MRKPLIRSRHGRFYSPSSGARLTTKVLECFYTASEDVFKLLAGKDIVKTSMANTSPSFDLPMTVIMAKFLEVLNIMFNDLNYAFQQLGLNMNMEKTKTMSNVYFIPIPVMIENTTPEVVHE
ncbi:uncharacterized protein LOC128200427 [Galleria mellonella]|uniref:Uncharacterized protein LOC128200427 n=1 Tax=Galleria mellonella TaxID=7137 RepID=A0ABM3MF97_GALME|nr:uncharacterized protein LOC128200427 [Galleria mellonella]